MDILVSFLANEASLIINYCLTIFTGILTYAAIKALGRWRYELAGAEAKNYAKKILEEVRKLKYLAEQISVLKILNSAKKAPSKESFLKIEVFLQEYIKVCQRLIVALDEAEYSGLERFNNKSIKFSEQAMYKMLVVTTDNMLMYGVTPKKDRLMNIINGGELLEDLDKVGKELSALEASVKVFIKDFYKKV